MCLQSFRIPTEIFFSILPWTSMTTHVILFCIMGVWASRSALKPLTVWIPTNWKILKEMGVPDHVTCFLRNLCTGKEAIIEPDMGQQTGSKLEKECIKAVYCHPACVLNYFSPVWLFAFLWTLAHQAPLFTGFSGKDYWSGLPCSPPEYLSDTGIKPMSLTSTALGAFSPLVPPGKPTTPLI